MTVMVMTFLFLSELYVCEMVSEEVAKSTIDVVERIRHPPNAQLDCGFRQGSEALFKQYFSQLNDEAVYHPEIYATDREQDARDFIQEAQRELARFVQLVLPHSLPEDYLFFLEFYGGLVINAEDNETRLEIFGLGPRVMEWYESVRHVNTPLQGLPGKPLLYIGYLRIRESSNTNMELSSTSQSTLGHKWVQFYLDISGMMQENSVLALYPEHDAFGRRTWRKVADSFIAWLEQVTSFMQSGNMIESFPGR
jgi:hypothetical protein